MLSVDQPKVVSEKPHPYPMPAVVGVGADEGQIVVWLAARVSCFESGEQFGKVVLSA